ncbi:uncharacterized protein [Nicotiana sylvestris]|uniref:uncharacterized protein n=1 Tax=Nicotiana sylvestris TaxID=4096 RepID=UPI00388C851C
MVEFDVIMGMDWLVSCHDNVDCRSKIVRFQFPGEPVLEWKGNTASPRGKFISYLKARKMIRKGCIYHLVQVQDVEVESLTIRSIPVVNKFPDVFPDELLDLPPEREKDEHADHLRIVLRVLQEGKLYAKFSKCEFWLNYIAFLGHVISGEGIRVDTQKIEALKDRLTLVPVLTFPEGIVGYVIYCDVSSIGLGCVLMQHEDLNLQLTFGGPSKRDWGLKWDDQLSLIKFTYNNSYHSSIQMAPYEALYGRKCRSPIGWFDVGESELHGPYLVQQAIEKVKLIRDRLLIAQSHQKSYSDI